MFQLSSSYFTLNFYHSNLPFRLKLRQELGLFTKIFLEKVPVLLFYLNSHLPIILHFYLKVGVCLYLYVWRVCLLVFFCYFIFWPLSHFGHDMQHVRRCSNMSEKKISSNLNNLIQVSSSENAKVWKGRR